MQKQPRLLLLSYALVLVLPLIAVSLSSRSTSAAQITTRSLTLQGVGANGGSQPNVPANHQFTFTIPANSTLGSIMFEYCTTASGTCTAPSSLNTSAATLGTSTGATFTSAVSVDANHVYITRTAAAFGPGAVTQQLLGINNPDNTICYGGTAPASNNCTFFVRISTYASTDTSGPETDTGVVAASTATKIDLSGYMPESLVFCTGGSISTTTGVPDCSTATSGSISFPDFSPTATSFTTSQMAASTNAGLGYAVTVNGATLTSGSNTIAAIGTTAEASILGKNGGQFGFNLVDNATPNVGVNVAPTDNGTNFRGQPSTGYETADLFRYATGDTIARSDSGGAGGTDAQIFTHAYIVNVPGSQPAGTYTTTLTYICTPTF